jgi:glycosyltransferase involved in cell wall biosynthesis
MNPILLSVCIPSYNRPNELGELLVSIARQPRGNWEIVISEDCAPKQAAVQAAVEQFRNTHPDIPVKFSSNASNLGFDGNLRVLLERASGAYCMFMGDDDLLCDGSLAKVEAAVAHPNVGVVLRGWQSIEKSSGRVIENHRYYPRDMLFEPGSATIVSFFRKAVFLSGVVLHRDCALKYATTRFDGRLLYQVWLTGRILGEMNGYYISDILSQRRVGGEHFFGSSKIEKGRFEPKVTTPAHSITFISGLTEIADALGDDVEPDIAAKIRHDLAAYSFPILSMHAKRLSRREFRRYADALARLGLGESWLFWVYFWLLSTAGADISERAVRLAKRVIGHTPILVRN